ncbi:EsaB/YukD family protein [Streptomyces sp. NPDC088923]|uniref:EsaB/YukD family protein n=1 Tax=Streptomyces sp. NPDC088923 TaxID=3365913 RepID=UPI00380C27B6
MPAVEDERCRVTIVGEHRRIDLSVPAHAAIAEYTPMLLRACGQSTADDTFPPAWSLALPGSRAFAPETSLAESGVVDGATLYLRDFAAGEHDEAEVADLAEEIGSANRTGRVWDATARARSSVVAGIAVLVGAFAQLDGPGPGRPLAGFGALIAGICLALLAAHATRRGWSLPAGLRLTAALAAVPLCAAAALALPTARTDTPALLVAGGIGALLGAVAARAAVPHPLTTAVLALTALCVPVTAALALSGAGLLESAAVVVVVLLGVLAVAPTATGHLIALSGTALDGGQGGDSAHGQVAGLVADARRLLIGLTVLCATLLVPALVLLAAADQVWALALSAAAGLALLLRAGLLNAFGAVLPQLVAGTAGLGACLALAPAAAGAPAWTGPAALIVVGLAVLARGTSRIFGDTDDEEAERPAWMSTLGLLLSVLTVPLALGVFGLFGHLQSMGTSL